MDDPQWGQWKVEGRIDPKKGEGNLTFKTDRVGVTPEKLRSLPLVPAAIWKEVQGQGDTAVVLAVQFGDIHHGTHYRLELRPKDATIQVTVADLVAQHASGEIVVADGNVVLRNLAGQAMGGEIRTNGELYLASEPEKLHLRVSVKNLDLDSLPQNWPVPRHLGQAELKGRVNGSVDVTVGLTADEVTLAGGGKGEIVNPLLNGIDLRSKPLEFSVEANGARFNTTMSKPVTQTLRTQSLLTGLLLLVVPPDPGQLQGVSAPGQPSSGQPRQALSGQAPAPPPPAGAGSAPPKVPPSRPMELDFGLQDVDVAQLLKGLGFELPYEIAGRLTFNIHATIPTDTPGNLKKYQFKGTASLPLLTVGGLELVDVQARMNFADGVLKLEELGGQVRGDAGGPTGVFSGTGSVEVSPLKDLSFRLMVQRISLTRVLTLLPNGTSDVKGLVQGTVRIQRAGGQAGIGRYLVRVGHGVLG